MLSQMACLFPIAPEHYQISTLWMLLIIVLYWCYIVYGVLNTWLVNPKGHTFIDLRWRLFTSLCLVFIKSCDQSFSFPSPSYFTRKDLYLIATTAVTSRVTLTRDGFESSLQCCLIHPFIHTLPQFSLQQVSGHYPGQGFSNVFGPWTPYRWRNIFKEPVWFCNTSWHYLIAKQTSS